MKYDKFKVKNKYMIAWAKANGVENGDDFRQWQYINLITDQHDAFREDSGMTGMESDYPEKLIEWLNKKY